MRKLEILATLCAVLAGAPVAAHEKGSDRAMGVVESITPERIVVKTADGHPVPFAVTAETRFTRGEKAARAQDVKVGQRVVVHGKRTGEARQAVEVKLGEQDGKK